MHTNQLTGFYMRATLAFNGLHIQKNNLKIIRTRRVTSLQW